MLDGNSGRNSKAQTLCVVGGRILGLSESRALKTSQERKESPSESLYVEENVGIRKVKQERKSKRQGRSESVF